MSTENRIPPGQQLVAPGKWPVIGERQPAQVDTPWSLSIFGEVEEELTFTLDQLHQLPQTTYTMDIHCVTRWSKLDVEFSGVLLKDLLTLARPNAHAKYASFIARSDRNHSSSLETDAAIEAKTLIALRVDGKPLEIGHGGPIRNIVTGRYFYKCVKWLEQIELLSKDRLGFWEAETGYHNEADPWLEQRYMAPSIDRRLAIKLIESRDFSGQELRSIDCNKRELENLVAIGASLRDSNFNHANLKNADFSKANLSNARFVESNLVGAKFAGADVEGADFSGANLCGADFTNSSMIGASFFNQSTAADGKEVLKCATIDKSTILPEEMIAPLFPAQLKFVKEQLRNAN